MRVHRVWAVLAAGRFVARVVAGMNCKGEEEEEGVQGGFEDIPEHWQLTQEQRRFINDLLEQQTGECDS